jgi:sugar phosphate permease
MLLGVGIGAATLLPCSLVIGNWFGARRGLAMGIAFAGTSLGGAGMTMLGNFAILRFGGWRAGYVALAIPMIVIVVPTILLAVRSRPEQAAGQTVHAAAGALPGLELGEALRTRSFWMIASAQFMFAFVAAGVGLHLITYLMGLGYTETFAAGMMSIVYLGTSIGKLVMGVAADRISARIALAINFAATALGVVLLLGAAHGAFLAACVIIFGFTLGVPLVLLPMVMIDSLGLKRFGSIGGLSGVFQTIGGVSGPVVMGAMYDFLGRYSASFEIAAALSVLGALAMLGCLRLEDEQARVGIAPATAA